MLKKSTKAGTDPFLLRFSTQYADDNTSDLKYLYRDYRADTGRWPNRDPIGERGGQNLYGFVRNNPVGVIDFLGLCTAGKLKDVKCNISVVPYGTTPDIIKNLDVLRAALSDVQLLDNIMDAVNLAASGVQGAVSAIESVADTLAESASQSGVEDMANAAIKLVKGMGNHTGYRPFTRIEYKKCECGLLWNSWKQYEQPWNPYNGISDLGQGTFTDRLPAVKAGAKTCKAALEEFLKAHQGEIEQ